MSVLTGEYAALTPYLLPLGSPKRVNVGDGFILDACEKLIGKPARECFSLRAPLTAESIDRINATRLLLVAGSNTLRDDFTLAPGCTLETLRAIKVPIALMGLGHYGVAEATRGMQLAGVAQLEEILSRFPYMSVRCDRSRDYVAMSAPSIAEKLLLTSCPVAYPVDGMENGFTRKPEYACLAVTVTDRAFLQEQAPMLSHAARIFPARRRVLVQHQDSGVSAFHDYARAQGFEVFAARDYRETLALYKQVDVHLGNRVHGHLKALSLGNPSFLMPFDLRQGFFAESLDFPLITELPTEEIARYDFARFTARRAQYAPAMRQFTAAVQQVLQ